MGWSAVIQYNPAVINVTVNNVRLFQAADGRSIIFNASDSTPDSDGSFNANAIDRTAPPNQDSGTGVLARITLKGVGPGLSPLTITFPSLVIGRETRCDSQISDLGFHIGPEAISGVNGIP